MNLKIDETIIILKARFEELENYTIIEADMSEFKRKSAEIDRLKADLNEQIEKFERIKRNLNASEITFTPVSNFEREELENALIKINIAIQQDEVWHKAISIATGILQGAGKLNSAAG